MASPLSPPEPRVLRQRIVCRLTHVIPLLMPATRVVVIQPLEMMINRRHTLPPMPTVILLLEQ